MKKSWQEMVQDYVDARLACGGCILAVIAVAVFGTLVIHYVKEILSFLTAWNENWAMILFMGTIVVMFSSIYVIGKLISYKPGLWLGIVFVLGGLVYVFLTFNTTDVLPWFSAVIALFAFALAAFFFVMEFQK